MNMRKDVINYVGGILFVCLIMVLMNTVICPAQECRVIRIQGGGTSSEIYLEPETAAVSKGTCIIWTNWVGAASVTVNFEDGKKCEDVTLAPVGFELKETNCYVTSSIPLGGTSSLRFSEKGSYEYSVKSSSGASVRGRIVVQ